MKRRSPSLLVLLLLAACGGGGGGPDVPLVDLGTISSTEATLTTVEIENPTGQAADVSLAGEVGPFRVPPGALPAVVAPGATFELPVEYVPGGGFGPVEGEIEVDFAGGRTVRRGVRLSAEVERLRLALLTTALEFGPVLPGDAKTMPVRIRNRSAVSTGHLGPVTVPEDFSVVSGLPLPVAPGATTELMIRYAPTGAGTPGGEATIASEDPDGPLSVALSATSPGREIIDLGVHAFDTSLAVSPFLAAQTLDLQLTVPADAIAFQIEAYVDPSTQIGLSKLKGPNGEDFENEDFTGFYLQYPDLETFVAPVPNTDDPLQQVIPGTWTLRIGRLFGDDDDVEVRVIVQRRPIDDGLTAALDLNVFFAEGIAISATTAEGDDDFQDILSRVDTLLSQQGIRLGDVDYYDIADLTSTPSVYDDVTNAEFAGLLELSGDPLVQEERLNYFLVREALGGGVLGVSAKLGGPTRGGTGASGVMGLYIDDPTTGQRDLVARVMAHEMGHYLGLRHTAEANGTHDQIADTTNCGSGSCSASSEKYLMHWEAISGHTVITDGQGLVLRGHGHMRPLGPDETALTAVAPLLHTTTAYDITVSESWCGTCRRCESKHDLGLGR